MDIKFVKSPNYTEGRNGRKIIAIVNHITAGAAAGAISWLSNPAAKASAHFVVTKTGLIYQLVKEEDTAFGAGIVNKPDWPLYDGTNPNHYTLNIEHEALAGEALTDIQYQATLWLHKYLMVKWSIPIDSDHIIGHYRLDSVNRKNDPGPKFPWNKLMSDLKFVNQTINIKIGEQKLDGIMIENKAFVPVREFSEALGMSVIWDENSRSIFIHKSKNVILESPDEINIFICPIPIKGILLQERTYVPVREMAESLGKRVIWDNDAKSVLIS